VKALAALILTAAAVLALASTEAGAAQPMRSPVAPTATDALLPTLSAPRLPHGTLAPTSIDATPLPERRVRVLLPMITY
jgi:hypothetical protein